MIDSLQQFFLLLCVNLRVHLNIKPTKQTAIPSTTKMTKLCPNCDQTPVQPCPTVSTSVHLNPPSWSQNTEPIVRIHREYRCCRLLLFASSNLITPTSKGLTPTKPVFPREYRLFYCGHYL